MYRRTILGTIQRMPLMAESEKQKYTNDVEAHYLHIKMLVSVGSSRPQEAISYMMEEETLTGKTYHPINAVICKYCACKPLFVTTLRVIRKLLKIPI